MTVEAEAGRLGDDADEPGWEVDPDDEWGIAVIATVGRQLKLRREAVGMRAGEFGAAVGYGEDLVYKVEGGKRIPRQEYLDRADEVLDAGGLISATWEDVKKVRYPKKIRDLTRLEAQAAELTAYGTHNLHGLLQTADYMRALFEMRRPAYSQDEVERLVSARVARKVIFERDPAPELCFVQEEATLRRPLGGRMVLRRQLEHLLELGQMRNVEIQVMPINRAVHAGMGGEIQVLKFADGTAVGRAEGDLGSRPVSELKHLRIMELRCGIIRAQALSPGESLAFIEQVLGEA
ncbi:helix-turn-helix domain-containing protein [Streptomyces sp. NPDC056296]|uniref:helix-turn-helix domain-containing protein n=1 Tax=Streptomyces sp. NPDC056296 TaxID=3345775 RepID=UPI0035DA3546